MIPEKINPADLIRKTESAKVKIAEGERELGGVRETVAENLDVLSHEASLDYMSKLNADLKIAVDGGDQTKAQEILGEIFNHKENMKQYQESARENTGDYIDNSTGEVDMEKFEKELNAFVAETFAIKDGQEVAKKAKISMRVTPPAQIDYTKLKEVGPIYFGQYTVNPETVGINYKEREPKIKILDMKEFVGKSMAGVVDAVVEEYGEQYHLPGLEYEKYLLENPDKVPQELKDGNFYCLVGSTFCSPHGTFCVPCVEWREGGLRAGGNWLNFGFDESGRVLLLEK